LHFHATTLGINVLGHLPTPKWLDHVMALLTGGEAFHDHHHDQPSSALHRPRKGLWNRIVDYNGTALLVFEKLGWAKNLKIAPQFA
ncbi:MAG: acyl-CoA desaturase, partial [Pseudomonadota bacterium]